MRRFNPPYSGKRYLLNLNTGEIHDLDNETDMCHIDEITPSHIYMNDSYMNCLIAAKLRNCPNSNGCYHCLREKDIG